MDKFTTTHPITMYQDNKSTIHIAEARSTFKRSRHALLRYQFIQQHIRSEQFQLYHLPTNEMIADILTKPIQGQQFIHLRNQLNILDHPKSI